MNHNLLKKNPELFGNLKNDIPSGIVVFLVALPLCLGISLYSGAPMFAGVIAGVVGGLIVPLISKAPLSISGPAAGLSVIVAAAIAELPNYETFLLAVILAGIFQIIYGIFRASQIGYYFPSSVISGMLTSIGLILILKQLPHAIGYDIEIMGTDGFIVDSANNTFTLIAHSLKKLQPGAIVISALTLIILITWEKTRLKKIVWLPAPLFVVIAGTTINVLLSEFYPRFALGEEHLVFIPSTRQFEFALPAFSNIFNYDVLKIAFTLSLVASLETLLTVEAIDKIDPFKRNTPLNRELVAQGAGNIVSGFLGGLPLTAVVVRGTTNINAGAKTKISAITHGALLLLAVLLIPEVLNKIPLAVLAAILIMVGYRLVNPTIIKRAYNHGLAYFIPFIVTVIAILLSDILIGIAIGTIVGIVFVARTNFHSAISIVPEGDTVTVKLNKDVSFLNKAKLVSELAKINDDTHVIIDGSRAGFIDYDIAEIINNFKASANLLHRKVEVKNVEYKTNDTENSFHRLLEGNRDWVKEMKNVDPHYFKNMAKGQSPEFLWIGCSDSRVPANEITKTEPGEIFVHRNIANLVIRTDFNLMSVLQYAVHHLHVKHIIVCGHYECGGVLAAMSKKNLGFIDNWLGNIKDVYLKYEPELLEKENDHERGKRLVELNVIEQVYNLSKISIIQEAWAKGKYPIIHGWVYDIENGALKDMEMKMQGTSTIPDIFRYQL